MKLTGAGGVHYCVTGVVAAGVACDYCSIFGKDVNDLSFALVAPLAPMTAYAGILNSLATRFWIVEVWYLPYLQVRRNNATGCCDEIISGKTFY